MMRIAAFSSARIFGGLRRLRFGAVLFGIWAIWEKAQRRLMHPRRDAISCRPDLPITNDGAVEGRLLGSAAEVDPGSDAPAGGSFFMPQRISDSCSPCRTTPGQAGSAK
jgi:hypothetical protein